MRSAKNIIGNGFIAKNIYKIKNHIKKSGYTIYAAGISDSKLNSKKDLKREIESIVSFSIKNIYKKVIYISTADVVDNLKKNTNYVRNKIKIENFIKKKFKHFIILRLPQIIGKSKNKKTIINFFYNNIKKKKNLIILRNVKRNIMDIDDVVKIIKVIIFNKYLNKNIITLSNKYFVKPIDIIKIIEKKLNIKAKYSYKNTAKQKWKLDYKKNFKFFKKANLRFDRNYLSKKINKYY